MDRSIAIVMGRKRPTEPDDVGSDEDGSPDYSPDELDAAEALAHAVKKGDPEMIVDAFRGLKDACESSYGDDGSAEGEGD